MFVAEISSLKKETYSLMNFNDLEDLVINSMGVDAWNAIMYFHETEIEKLKENEVYVEDIKNYDTSLVALRSGITDEIDVISELVGKINNCKRLDRKMLIKELTSMKERLSNNEGL